MLPGAPGEGTWKVPSLSSFPESCIGCTVTLPAYMPYSGRMNEDDADGMAMIAQQTKTLGRDVFSDAALMPTEDNCLMSMSEPFDS